MGNTAGRGRGGPPNKAASSRSSSQSSPSGHVTPAASARCRYSWTVPRPIEQLRAICRSPRPTSNLNLRTSLVLRTDNLLAGKRSSLSWGGFLPLCCPAPLALWKLIRRSRTRFRDRPKTVRLHPGIGVSPSSRITVRNHPGLAFGIITESRSLCPGIPPYRAWGVERRGGGALGGAEGPLG